MRPEPALAKDLYVSPWFRLARTHIEATGSPWFILSAKYGPVVPDHMLAPYQQTLNKRPVVERRERANRVQAQMAQALPAASLIVVFAVVRYRENLIGYLRQRPPVIEVQMEGLPIGKQLQWLRAQVDRLSNRQSALSQTLHAPDSVTRRACHEYPQKLPLCGPARRNGVLHLINL
jgi:hypothetical protein